MSPFFVVLVLGDGAVEQALWPYLESWAAHRGARLESPSGARQGLSEPPEAVGGLLEARLEDARLAVDSLDAARARQALEEVEAHLVAHPELPQAAWLRAERHRLLAALARRLGGEEAAASLERSARVLEGPRSLPFPDLADEPELVRSPRRVLGLDPEDVLEWDGEAVSGATVLASQGQHQVRVLRRGRLWWAGWVELGDEDTVELPIPTTEPCSDLDLGAPRASSEGPVPDPSVRCPSWIVARRRPGASGVLLATCEGGRCGSWQAWSRRDLPQALEGRPSPPAPATPGGPTWVTWTLVSLGAGALGAVLAWQHGAFREADPPPPVWRYEGFR